MVEQRPGDAEGARRKALAPAEKRRLEELKRQIEAGEYETDEKVEIALRRLVADLRGLAAQRDASRGDESGGESP